MLRDAMVPVGKGQLCDFSSQNCSLLFLKW